MCCEHQALYTLYKTSRSQLHLNGRRYFLVFNYFEPDVLQMFYHEDGLWCPARFWRKKRMGWDSNLGERTVPLPINMMTIAIGVSDVL
jgi:hypothetical protein